MDNPVGQLQDDSGHAWTAIALGRLGDRDWALLLPGQSAAWVSRSGFEQFVENVGWSLAQVANQDRAEYASRFQRRLHAFARRLAREHDAARVNSLVLRSIASQVGARTGALATFRPGDDALAIVTTLGYPISIVEHLRFIPAKGLSAASTNPADRLSEIPDPLARGDSISHRFVHGPARASNPKPARRDRID